MVEKVVLTVNISDIGEFKTYGNIGFKQDQSLENEVWQPLSSGKILWTLKIPDQSNVVSALEDWYQLALSESVSSQKNISFITSYYGNVQSYFEYQQVLPQKIEYGLKIVDSNQSPDSVRVTFSYQNVATHT